VDRIEVKDFGVGRVFLAKYESKPKEGWRRVKK